MRCSVVWGITLRLLVTNISSSSHAINKLRRFIPAIIVSHLAGPWSGGVVLITPGRLQRWQHAVKPDIGPESRFLPTPPAFDTLVRGSPSHIAITFGAQKNYRMVWLPDGKKIVKTCLFVLTQSTNVTHTHTYTHTHTHTDRQTDRHRMTSKAVLSQHRAAKIT